MDNETPIAPAATLALPHEVVAMTGKSVFSLFRDVLETVIPALLIALAIHNYAIQPTRVDGVSMEPSLHNHERLLIDKVSYRFASPARGDVVVFHLQERANDPLIKRVIGLPGDVVAVRNGHVYLDGQPLDEPYLAGVTPGDMAPQMVPAGHLFVLGDNRGASNDSRIFGMVPVDDVIGRAWVRYWPTNALSLIP